EWLASWVPVPVLFITELFTPPLVLVAEVAPSTLRAALAAAPVVTLVLRACSFATSSELRSEDSSLENAATPILETFSRAACTSFFGAGLGVASGLGGSVFSWATGSGGGGGGGATVRCSISTL